MKKIWKSLIWWGIVTLFIPPLTLKIFFSALIEHFSNTNGNIWILIIYSYLLVIIGLIPYFLLLKNTLKQKKAVE